MGFDEAVKQRNATAEQISDAQAITLEIKHAWDFPEENRELSKVHLLGYQASIGSPHYWWDLHCKSYQLASEKYKRARDLHTVCLLADELIKEIKGESK